MQFASLSSLWFGLALPAIVLLYLFKRRYIDTPVSSNLLWNRILRDMEANRPWQKLRSRLLLIIQLLAGTLLVLALMQPFFMTKQAIKGHVILVLDNSASMQAEADSAQITRFDLAKQRILDWIQHEGKGSSFTLLTLGNEPQVILSKAESVKEVAEALTKLQINHGASAYTETMSLAGALTRDDPRAVIRLYTDGQWPESTAGLNITVPLTIDKITHISDENVSVVQFGVRDEAARGKSAAAVAVIKNWGSQDITFDTSIYAGEILNKVQTVKLLPGEQKSLYYNALPLADYYDIKLSAADHGVIDQPSANNSLTVPLHANNAIMDQLSSDNEAFAFLTGNQPKTALLLSEGNLFLEKALMLAQTSVLKAQKNGGLYSIPDSKFDFIIIDAAAASSYTSDAWLKLLAEKPVWYIHSGLDGTESKVPTAAYSIVDHPVTQYIRFQDTHIAGALEGKMPLWGQSIASAGKLPLIYAGEERGQNRLMFMFDLHQSDLPLRSEFPILVQNAAAWLSAKQAGSLGLAIASQRMELTISPKTASAEWVPLSAHIAPQPLVSAKNVVSAVQTVPSEPGLYRLDEKDQAQQLIHSRLLAVAVDPQESNLANQPKLNFTHTQQTSPNNTNPLVETKTPLPLMSGLIALLLAVTLIEWGVYQRGNSL